MVPEQRMVLVQSMVFITAYSLGPEADSVYTIIRRNDFSALLVAAWAGEITQDPFLATVHMQEVRTEDLDSIGQELLPPLPPIPYTPPIIKPDPGVQIDGTILAVGLSVGLLISCCSFIFYRRWVMRTRRAKAVAETVGKLARQKKQEKRELLKKSLAEKAREKERRVDGGEQEWAKAERQDKKTKEQEEVRAPVGERANKTVATPAEEPVSSVSVLGFFATSSKVHLFVLPLSNVT
jgi:hypothetical protein